MKIRKETRTLGALAVLAISALGVPGCATRFAAPYGSGAHLTIIVAATDAAVPDPGSLSKKQKQEADWYSWPGSTLMIQFADPSLFPKLTCRGNHCASGPIKEEAAEKPYGYHARVSFGEQKASVDPTIWIQP